MSDNAVTKSVGRVVVVALVAMELAGAVVLPVMYGFGRAGGMRGWVSVGGVVSCGGATGMGLAVVLSFG